MHEKKFFFRNLYMVLHEVCYSTSMRLWGDNGDFLFLLYCIVISVTWAWEMNMGMYVRNKCYMLFKR